MKPTLFLRVVRAGTETVFLIELQIAPCSCSRVTTGRRNTVLVYVVAWKTRFLRRPRLVLVASVEKAGRTAVELLSKLPYSRGVAAAE